MTSLPPRIAIPEPSSTDREYSQRSWPVYAGAIERAGGVPVPAPLGESQSTLARIASSCSGILLPGSGADIDPEKYGEQRIPECGRKDAARESADDLLLQDAFNLHKPILAICYGLQSLNVWRNGTLIQDLPKYLPANLVNHNPGRGVLDAHAVALVPGSRLSKILAGASGLNRGEQLSVNSTHHQAIRQPGDQMVVVALSPEDGVIEGLEGQKPEQFVLGVQWHPERTYDTSAASRALFEAFIQAASDWRPRPIRESVVR